MSILYITEQGASLYRNGERLIVKKGNKVLYEVPAIKVDQVVILGGGNVSTPALNYLMEQGKEVAFLTTQGRYRGTISSQLSQNGKLRQLQYKLSMNEAFSLEMARRFIRGKIENMVYLLSRQRERDRRQNRAVAMLMASLDKVRETSSIDSLRGYEGSSSAAYFEAFGRLLEPTFTFKQRVKRPPTDPVNICLSLGYTILYNRALSTLRLVGLDPFLGFLHQPRYGHAALASDLIEEFRSIVVDSTVLTVVKKRMIKPEHFRNREGKLEFSRVGIRKFLHALDATFQRQVVLGGVGIRVSYQKAIEFQARQIVESVLTGQVSYQPVLPGKRPR